MHSRLLPVLLTAVLLAPAQRADAAPTARLTVNIAGLETQDGVLRLALFDTEPGYDGGAQPVRSVALPASGAHSAVFEGVPPGPYAIRAYHDRNGNGRLDANALGIPTEPYAFSNNAQGRFGPAKWKDAVFAVPAGEALHTLTLR